MFEAYKPRDYEQNFLKPAKVKHEKRWKNSQVALAGERETYKSKPRAPIPKVSPRRKEENKLYEKVKAEWRKEREAIDGGQCQVIRDAIRCPRRASRSPHHMRGRVGRALCDAKYFLAVCEGCHSFIHGNPAESYEKGWMIKRI